MNASRAMAVMVVVIVIIGIFLLAPIINYTFTGSNFGVGSYEVTAQVNSHS